PRHRFNDRSAGSRELRTVQSPTAPAIVPMSTGGFGSLFTTGGPRLTSFAACLAGQGTPSCFAAATVHPRDLKFSRASAPNAPVNLAAAASGSSVTLTWGAPSGGDPVTNYIIEAGSASGLATLRTPPPAA